MKDLKKEATELFLQYSSNGYAGGVDGLRCSMCDRKYSGESSCRQLCAVCLVHEYIDIAREKTMNEIYDKIKAAHKYGDDRDSNWQACMENIFNPKDNERLKDT